VLYEASTGFSPDRFPDVPADWLTGASGDEALEFHEIVLKACEGQRPNRYQTVEELQADLALLQSGQSVRHMRALKRRYARLRVTGVVGTALLVCAIVAALLANYRARLAAQNHTREVALRQQVERSLGRAEAAEQTARQQLYTALVEQARATVRSGELGQRVRALDAIRRAAAITNCAELRGAVLSALALPDLQLEKELPKPGGTTLVELDPALSRVAFCRGTGPLEIVSVAEQRLLTKLPASTNFPAFNARWSRDGRFLAVKRDRTSPGDRADLEVWDVSASRRLFWLQAVDFGIADFHPHRPEFLAGLHDGKIGMWNCETEAQVARFEIPERPMLLRFSPDGTRFAVAYQRDKGTVISVYAVNSGDLLIKQVVPDYVGALDWHPDGNWIVTADHSGAIELIEAATGNIRLLGRHKAQAVMAAFSADGDYLLTAGWEQEFICWDFRRQANAFTIGLNSFQAQLSTDGATCAIITGDAVQLHAFERPSSAREFPENLGPRLRYAVFSPDGHWLAACASGQLGVWNLTRHGPAVVCNDGADARLFFSPTGELFASRDDACFRWQIKTANDKTGTPLMEPLTLTKPEEFTSLCLASNLVVLTRKQNTCMLSSDQAASSVAQWAATADGVSGASPDGRWLGIFQPYSRVLHVYRLPQFEKAATLTNSASIGGFEFSPLGDELAVSSFRGVELWSTATWGSTRLLTNFVSLHYVPGSNCYWLTRDFHTAGLYDAQTLQLLLPLPLGTLPLAASPNGRYLAASVDSTRLQVWDMEEVKHCLKDLRLEW